MSNVIKMSNVINNNNNLVNNTKMSIIIKNKKSKTTVLDFPYSCTCEQDKNLCSFFPVLKTKKSKTFFCPYCGKKHNIVSYNQQKHLN